MGRSRRGRGMLAPLVAVVSLALSPAAALRAAPPPAAPAVMPAGSALGGTPVCAPAAPGRVSCDARMLSRHRPGTAAAAAPPAGAYTPADLQSAYLLPAATAGDGQTIALVDAFDDPAAAADLAVYRTQFGLPPCTSVSGCLRKVNMWGGTALPGGPPSGTSDWVTEISLDLDMASAACPRCALLLVEAADASTAAVDRAVDTAVALGATEVSLSLGGPEYPSEVGEEIHYQHPGVAITAAGGDFGFGTQFPAASRYVTAVGGTALVRDASVPRGWRETAWIGTGSGCSPYIAKPVWQGDRGCGGRTLNDVAAVADQPGVAVYNSAGGGWMAVSGTSVGAPLVAAVYALRGGAGGSSPGAAVYQRFYAYPGRPGPAPTTDVVGGADGTCVTTYLCTAVPGYDGPTGLGSPWGAPAPPAVTVAVEGGDGGLWRGALGAGFTPLGGVLSATPAVVVLPPPAGGGRLYVATGSDHDVWARGDATGWRPLSTSPVRCVGPPAASLDPSGALLVVACTGADGALWWSSAPLGPSFPQLQGWSSSGGVLGSGPAAGVVAGSLLLLGDGTDGRVWARTPATGWVAEPWRCLGQPALASLGGSAVFACHGADGALWTATSTGSAWSAVRSLGGRLVGGVGAALLPDGTVLVGEGTDGALWQVYVSPSGAPGPWGPFGGLLLGGAAAAGG